MSTDVSGAVVGVDPDAPQAAHEQIDERQHFVFRVGQTLLAVAPAHVDRVVPSLRPVRIPTAPKQVLGVAHLQGRIVTVVALHRALKVDAVSSRPSGEARTLVLRSKGGIFATDVHQVLGLQATLAQALRTPERADEIHPAFTAEYESNEGTVTVLDVDRLFDALSGQAA